MIRGVFMGGGPLDGDKRDTPGYARFYWPVRGVAAEIVEGPPRPSAMTQFAHVYELVGLVNACGVYRYIGMEGI